MKDMVLRRSNGKIKKNCYKITRDDTQITSLTSNTNYE